MSSAAMTLKVRKPYTITKQRERWTDEEHKKFLEALKLYGRAWRRIEEHVCTKTTVQIRSHAQKFFSKVVRESTGSNESSLKPNDIPPPRPKRKPMHPYPRKLVISTKTGTPLSDQRPRTASLNLSVSEKENQSPTSVLSEIGSDTIIYSNMPTGPLPVSSASGMNTTGCVQSKPIMSLEENGSPSPIPVDTSANLDEQVTLKLELFPQVDALITGEGTAAPSSTQCLKLFGKTVLITEGCKPSLSTSRTCHTQDAETNEGMERQTQPRDSTQMKISLENTGYGWSALSCGAAAAIYYMPLFENQSSHVFPRWISNLQLHSPVAVKVSSSYVGKGAQDNEIQDEGSLTASTTGSVNAEGDADRSGDVETEFCRSGLEKDEEQSTFLFKASNKICLGEKIAKTGKALKGFVPYNRCLAERNIESSVTGEEKEEQKIRLCL